uniref:Envelope fusion protein n=1 Tax=Bombyx mori TaxID=7091 RepID=A0A8R2R326_BOMMO|nr:uncharacterized protein LOC119630360 [Bombyx mori]
MIYRMILLNLLTRHLTTAHEIKLETLENGPGLLPFKLGQTRLVSHYHSFLQYIELADVDNRLDSVQTQLKYFKDQLDEHTYLLYELQINYLTSKITKINCKINSLKPNRVKRGLIDGLGSIVKSITGNLDQSDAELYSKAIKILQNNDNQLSSELNQYISLNKAWMTEHTQLLSEIAKNQEKINVTLSWLLDSKIYADSNLLKYAKFAQLLAIISENIEDLYNELCRIENILSFIRASSTHHSMISIDTLSNMTDRLRNLYTENRILNVDLREYYNIIKPGYYYVGKKIVIVFKFPVISPDEFELYKLTIAPNKHQLTFVPPYPFIATNKKAFMYIEAECPKYNRYYLCEENINHQPRDDPDCIHDLIYNQAMNTSCQPTSVSFTKEAMEQLDDKHYVLIFPETTKIELHCQRLEYSMLQGSYLVTIPQNCKLRTGRLTLANNNDQINGQPLKITEIPKDAKITGPIRPHIKLTSLNLEKIHQIQDDIIQQHPVDLEQSDVTNQALFHTTIPFYGALCGAIVLAVVIAVHRHKSCNITLEKKPREETSKFHPYESPEEPQKKDRIPATFALKIIK